MENKMKKMIEDIEKLKEEQKNIKEELKKIQSIDDCDKPNSYQLGISIISNKHLVGESIGKQVYIYSDINERWKEFSKSEVAAKFRLLDMISLALDEFMDKYGDYKNN